MTASGGGVSGQVRTKSAPLRNVAERLSLQSVLALLLVGHVVTWTLFPILWVGDLDRHTDMAEAYAWALEPSLGYSKHPPFLPWMIALWFKLFPVTPLAFNLLSALNSAIGLAGVWALAGHFFSQPARLLAVLALAVTPFYTVLAVKLNANSVLLSLWPWAAWASIRAARTLDLPTAAVAGALAASAMLAKYTSAVALASILAALTTLPQFGAMFRTAVPLIVAVVTAFALVPHVAWVVQADFSPIRYVGHARATGTGHLLGSIVRFVLAEAALMLPMATMFVLVVGAPRAWPRRDDVVAALRTHRTHWILALGPCLFLILAALATHTRLTTPWGIPLWFGLSIALVASVGAAIAADRVKQAALVVMGLYVILLLAAPMLRAIPYLRQDDKLTVPHRLLAEDVTALWRRATGQPLRLVAGSSTAIRNLSFFSADHPSTFERFDMARSPWVTPERLARQGVLVVCVSTDADCHRDTLAYNPAIQTYGRVTRRSTYLGLQGPEVSFDLYVVPPKSGN